MKNKRLLDDLEHPLLQSGPPCPPCTCGGAVLLLPDQADRRCGTHEPEVLMLD